MSRAHWAATICLFFIGVAQAEVYELQGVESLTGRGFEATLTVTKTGGLVLNRGPHGRVSVTSQVEGLKVEQRLLFFDGSVANVLVLEGQGRRQDDGLVAWLPHTNGLTGVEGVTSTSVTLVLRDLGNGMVETHTVLGATVIRHARGKRVGAQPAVDRPEAPSALTDAPLGLPSLEGTRAEGYHRYRGRAFVRGDADPHRVDPNDIHQGRIGSCYLLATLAAVARHHKGQLIKRIRPEREAWRVRFGPDDPGTVVDGWFPYVTLAGVKVPAFARFGDRHSDGSPELWPMLFEKAYAQINDGYADISGGHGGEVLALMLGTELESATGRVVAYLRGARRISPGEAWYVSLRRSSPANTLRLAQRLEVSRLPAVTGTRRLWTEAQGVLAGQLGLRVGHAYALWGVRDGKVFLYNPWGHDHPTRGLTPSEWKDLFEGVSFARF